jgi:hypothetical protein
MPEPVESKDFDVEKPYNLRFLLKLIIAQVSDEKYGTKNAACLWKLVGQEKNIMRRATHCSTESRSSPVA